MRSWQARSEEFAMGVWFKGWKQHQTILLQILIGFNADWVGFTDQIWTISNKKVFKNFFLAIYKILRIQNILLSSSRGQGNFRGLEAKAKDFKTSPRGPTSAD